VEWVRIGIDASLARARSSGTGRYAAGLLDALLAADRDNDYVLYFRRADVRENPFFPPRENVRVRVTDAPLTLLRIHANLSVALRCDRVDLYHSLGFFLPALWWGTKVVTIHDLHTFILNEYWWQPGLRISSLMLRAHIPIAVAQARRIVTPSRYTRDTLCERFRVSPERVVVAPAGVDSFFRTPPTPEELAAADRRVGTEPFFLQVGALVPMKNLAGTIRTLGRVRSGGRLQTARLIVVGTPLRSAHARELRALVARLGLSDAVTFTGYVDDRALRALYARALALVAPSFGEGFGLPLVEAMACGTPIIASNVTAMPEVAEDAALTVDPHDLDSLGEAMERVARDTTLRCDLAARGRQRAARYTWERTAHEVLRAYREA